MKYTSLLIFVLVISLITAVIIQAESNKTGNETENRGNRAQNKSNETGKNNSQGIGQDLRDLIEARKREFREGNYTGPMGQFLNVRELATGLRELRSDSISAVTRLNITTEDIGNNRSKLIAHLSNGKNSEIKIMPDSASEKALERLRLKVCSAENNCTIQLKEVGKRDDARVKYEVQTERHSKILWIFQKKMGIKAEVDAENEEVKVRKPWWAFLASEPAE